MLAQGQGLLDEDNSDHIAFTRANFFESQQYMGASVYFIRQCTRNWADHNVITILKAIVFGLEGSAPGTPLLINNMILPEPGSNVSHI